MRSNPIFFIKDFRLECIFLHKYFASYNMQHLINQLSLLKYNYIKRYFYNNSIYVCKVKIDKTILNCKINQAENLHKKSLLFH